MITRHATTRQTPRHAAASRRRPHPEFIRGYDAGLTGQECVAGDHAEFKIGHSAGAEHRAMIANY